MKLKGLIYFCLCVLLILGCTLQKRSYRSGYYISWNKNHEKSEKKNDQPVVDQINLRLYPNTLVSQQAIAALKTPAPTPVFTPLKNILGSCDTVIFRDGKIVAAKVSEINATEIKYKYCNNPEGPLFTVYKNDVATIIYANGTVENFEKKPMLSNTNDVNTGQYVNKQAQKNQAEKTFRGWLYFLIISVLLTVLMIALMSQPGNSGSYGAGCILALGVFVFGLCSLIALVGTIVSAVNFSGA